MIKIFIVVSIQSEQFLKAFGTRGGAEMYVEELDKDFNVQADIVEQFIVG